MLFLYFLFFSTRPHTAVKLYVAAGAYVRLSEGLLHTILLPMSARVAIVGGGIAGSLCGLVLRSRGFAPTILDQGARAIGGRLGGGREPDSGAAFLRASDAGSQFASVLEMLAREKLVAPWTGRFGILGSKGGLLPLEVARGTQVFAMRKDGEEQAAASDGGDFCGFVAGSTSSASPLYVGMPSNAAVCEGIASLAGIPVLKGQSVTGAALNPAGRWRLELGGELGGGGSGEYDALVLASHDARLAAATVDALATAAPEEVAGRMGELASSLRRVREEAQPAFTLSAYYRGESLARVPFDILPA